MKTSAMNNVYSGNPIIKHTFTADPTAIEFQEKIYLCTGHDEADKGVQQYIMKVWKCFSSSDLINWEDHGNILNATDFSWAKGDAFASKLVFKAGLFYFYAAVTHGSIAGKAIGVAVASSPVGPFKDAIGAALINQDMIPDKEIEMANLDPSVLIDDDGKAYIFWGNSVCYCAGLDKSMTRLDGEIRKLELPGFQEGVHIHKRSGWYYLAYGYGKPEKIAYCMSSSINGPWEYKGILNEIAGNCETNRAAIVDFKDRSLFFYHNGSLETGGSYRRSVCLDELFYNADGTLKRVVMTTEGIGCLSF